MSEKIKKSLPYLTIVTALLVLTLMFIFKQTLFAQGINGGTPASITSVSTEASTSDQCTGSGSGDCVTNEKICLEYDPCDSTKCIKWSE